MLATGARADEGMWLLPLLQKMNANAIKEAGCRLSPDQIYSINHTSLKDAIVIFGGGCTGEVISAEGLLVTNHHCGYSSIQKLSTDENNYLENGYWATTRDKELPVSGLSVTFLKSMTDVTGRVEKARKQFEKQYADSTGSEALVEKAVSKLFDDMAGDSRKDNPGCLANVTPFYNDNVFYLIVYKRYTDVRFVGAPPASIGKFGGETDNWMWPRHTGDFSMFRIYADKNNEPAEYSADNVPYQAENHLKVSLNGVKENDFAMVMGYPGRTQRFQTAAQLENMMDLHDISIEARTLRQSIMWDAMEADPAVRLKYANKYASSANGWKKWIGEKKAFADLGIIAKEEAKEADFMKWVDAKSSRKREYGTAISQISDAVDTFDVPIKVVTMFNETIGRIELLDFSLLFDGAFRQSLMSSKDTSAALEAGYEAIKNQYKDYYEPLDRKEAAALMQLYRKNADKAFYPNLGQDFATMDIDAFVEKMFDNSVFTSAEKLRKAIDDKDYEAVKGTEVLALSSSARAISASIFPQYMKGQNLLAKGSKSFGAGLMEWRKGEPSYPDANFTMRLTYGNVLPYSPKDAVTYRYYTTLTGVMEKEDSTNYEFKVPAGLKELYEAKDYGQYADDQGNVVTCFLTNNDITGGNSGSPVLNANGELIGLAFDGNWESMSSDVMFEPDLQRCICVDIRYVLFLVDKLGGAGNLIKEMDIVKN